MHFLTGRKCKSNTQYELCTSRGGKTHILRGRKCQREDEHEVRRSRGRKTHRLKDRHHQLHFDTLCIHQDAAIFHCSSCPMRKINNSGTVGA